MYNWGLPLRNSHTKHQPRLKKPGLSGLNPLLTDSIKIVTQTLYHGQPHSAGGIKFQNHRLDRCLNFQAAVTLPASL